MPEPILSIVMPVFNAGTFLRVAVLSVIHQTFRDWELLIIDDGSSDNSIESISDLKDNRIRFFRDGANKGLAARLNEAVKLAQGQFIARMDQDDISYPDRLRKQLQALSEDKSLDLIATRAIKINENNQVTGLFPFRLTHKDICETPWKGFYFPHPTWMGKKEWFVKNPYKIPGPYFCEDQELLLRSYTSSRFHTLDEILFGYRIREKINPEKLKKTRWALFKIQSDFFWKNHQYHFLALAFVAFIGRRWQDFMMLSKDTPSLKDPSEAINKKISDDWQKVIDQLSKGTGW